MTFGPFDTPWWGVVVATLVFTHITIIAVTVYLHRNQAHRAMSLHPLVQWFFRFWLWLTTGMNTKEWVAVHRKHHAFVETKDDPHSPKIYGIRKVLLQGTELYREAAKDDSTLNSYGHGTPNDWWEEKIFSGRDTLGIFIMMGLNLALFGPIGLTVWAVQMAWIPIFAAGIINGAAHWRGYRNFETADSATNIVPWGIVIGGEELHNNHHAFASSAKFSNKPWEFDIGWLYIRILSAVGLAKVKKLAPVPRMGTTKQAIDKETLSSLLGAQWHVLADYSKQVLARVHREELRGAAHESRSLLKRVRPLINRNELLLNEKQKYLLAKSLSENAALAKVYDFRCSLQAIFHQRQASEDSLLQQLQNWCRKAEDSGIAALAEFSAVVRAYSLEPARGVTV
ncbi:MAG: DesA family fatty acid desaturase [Gammaproteobacteria bacterium]